MVGRESKITFALASPSTRLKISMHDHDVIRCAVKYVPIIQLKVIMIGEYG